MARIPDEEIKRLKREVSLERLAEARGVKLKRSGKELIGLCPFHEDRNPSLNIDPVKNVWHCKGACGKGGDVIEWVKHAEGVSFTHAVELLKRDFLSLAAKQPGPPPKKSTTVKLPPLAEQRLDDKKLLEGVVHHYHETLKQSPEVQQYLIKRGLGSAEMIEQFRLGFANRTLGYLVPASNRVAGEEQRGRLKELGVFRSNGREHLRGSLVIPIFNLEGEVVQMYGRKVTRQSALRDETPAHLYLPGPHRGVWNERALIASKEIILCEALIDALTFWCAGYRHVTASYGVNGFTDDHRAALQKHGTQRIYIAYDRDEAGERAAQKLAEELMAMGMECFRVQFPKSMDANEFALKVIPATKSLGMLLGKAAWLGKGQRPTVAVSKPRIETQQPVIEEKIEPAAKKESQPPTIAAETEEATPTVTEEKSAAKEKISETNEANTQEESDLPLAAQPPLAALPTGAVVARREVPVEVSGETVYVTLGERRYRILELGKNTAPGALHVNIMVTSTNARGETRLHVDKLDLYAARLRSLFAKQAAKELGHKEESIERDLATLILKLEGLQHEFIEKTLKPQEEKIAMSTEEQSAALELLRDPQLLERVLADFEKCGVVGEETNKRLSYLAAVSRLLEKPLAIVVQSASSAGKSSLMEAVLEFMPEEQRESYTAMTGQALFYMGQKNLQHKILAIAEQQGAERASYPLKLLQSEGVLKIASTGKDPASGKLVTHDYLVEGPVMIFLTTTAEEVDEELLNRSIVLTVNEEQEQTRAIHQKQREAQTLDGLWARQARAEVLRVHRNAQRLLKPLAVVNEHVGDLTFPDRMTRTRRDHLKFLTLINAIALLHQYQRPLRSDTRNGKTLEYIEATVEDVKLAWELASEVLVRSLDELQPQTKRLLLLIDEMVSAECARQEIERADFRFSRRDVRRHTAWGDSVLKKHLHRLEELEYLIVHRGGRGQSFVYELYFERDRESGQPVLPGVAGPEICGYDTEKSRLEGGWSPASRPQVAGVARGGHGEESPILARRNGDFSQNPEKHTTGESAKENRVVPVAAKGK